MERLLVAAVLVALAVVVAFVLERRRPEPPTQPRWAVPTQPDRADFGGADRERLGAEFTSPGCESCRRAPAKAAVRARPRVACQGVA